MLQVDKWVKNTNLGWPWTDNSKINMKQRKKTTAIRLIEIVISLLVTVRNHHDFLLI